MIKIRKTKKPRKLAKDGVAKTDLHRTEYDKEPEKYRSGKKKLEVEKNKNIYGSKCIREILEKSHYNKCCYCESRFSSTSFGRVEHFRPKNGVKQSVRDSIEYPGYYWLAYAWENLYYSCEICNNKKGNLFPLDDNSKRARDHHDDIDLERPLLVDPGGAEDPRNHIGFYQEIPIGKSKQGRVTIEILCLDRRCLNEARKERLEVLKRFHDIVRLSPYFTDEPQLAQKAKDFLDSAVKACAEFSSMAQDLLAEEQ